jgi:hypothetical protein
MKPDEPFAVVEIASAVFHNEDMVIITQLYVFDNNL